MSPAVIDAHRADMLSCEYVVSDILMIEAAPVDECGRIGAPASGAAEWSSQTEPFPRHAICCPWGMRPHRLA